MKTYYIPKDGINPDTIYGGGPFVCIPEEEIARLSHEWGVDLMEQMQEATQEDIEEFGVYEDEPKPMTEYEELLAAATAPDADQDDINALGAWLDSNDPGAWNGEYYDADGIRLYPVIEWNEEADQGETVGYEIR